MSPRCRRLLTAFIMALVLSSAWIALSTTFTLADGDFSAFYTAAVMARHGEFHDLYNERLQAETQRRIVTRPNTVYFVRPHVYAAILAPLALLPIRQAFAGFILLCSAVLMGCWYWAYCQFGADAVLLLALFPVAILSFAFGQDVVLFLGLFVLSYFLFERNWPLLSGMLMGLVFIKPHLMLLIPVALLVQRRWRVLFGVILAGALEASASLALSGFSGASSYLHFLGRHQQGLSPTPERMMNVYAIGINLGLTAALSYAFDACLILLALACVAITCWKGQWWQAFAASLVGTLLIAPHTYLYDSTLILLPAVLTAFLASAPLARAAAVAFCTPLPSLLQLLNKPWPVVPALILLTLLVGLAADTVFASRRARHSLVQPAAHSDAA